MKTILKINELNCNLKPFQNINKLHIISTNSKNEIKYAMKPLIKNGEGLKINQCFPKIPYSIGVKINNENISGINE